MAGAGSGDTSALVALIRKKGRWPAIGQALAAAMDEARWRAEGFPSPTAWLDHLAARGARSTTYLSRCMSTTRYVAALKAADPSLDVARLESRPLSAIEEFKRQTGGDIGHALSRLPDLLSGRLTYHVLRQMAAEQDSTPARAERNWFPETVLQHLPQLLAALGCPADAEILREPRIAPVSPDAVLIDPRTGSTSIVEVKTALSRRSLADVVQRLLAYASLGRKMWLILPADSELPADEIIHQLRSIAIRHVGVLLLNPSTAEVVQVKPPETEAPWTSRAPRFLPPCATAAGHRPPTSPQR